jgi:phenylpropionate dioxygenase-like ring-hydroxylating dioxygenase large terminal subunit
MFEGFAKVWTPVLLSKQVGERPVAVTVAGEELVLFRDGHGRLAALSNHCLHRGAALSLGKVFDGCLHCPFHGWAYAPNGEVKKVPLSAPSKHAPAFTQSLPVREIGELIWLYTGQTAQPPEPQVPPSLVDPGLTRNYLERRWSCHWTRAMENMLDSPHLPFVHRTTIGRPLARRMKPGSVMTVTWEDTPFGGTQRSSLDGEQPLAHLDFYKPNMMALHIPIPGKVMRLHALVIPVDLEHTRLIVVGARDYLKPRLFNFAFTRVNAVIAGQDQPVVESVRPKVVPPPGDELSVPTDRATLQFRKYYFETLAPG